MRPGSFPPSLPAQLADALRRIGELERRSHTGTGVSTAFRGHNTRTMQAGFPAELTGVWESAGAGTAYPWKALALEADVIDNPDVQLTGTLAVTPDNNEDLPSGTRGWMETDPQAAGYIFIADVTAFDATPGACTGLDWLTLLRPSDCLRLTFSHDPPPAVALSVADCAECPDGASAQYTFTLSGGTGDFAALNGTWTVARDTLCVWLGTKSGADGWTAELRFQAAGSFSLNMLDADGNVSYAAVGLADCRGPITTTPDEVAHGGTGDVPAAPVVTAVPVDPPAVSQSFALAYDSETGLWVGDELLAICGVDYSVTLDAETEELTLTGPLPDGGGQPFSLTRRATCGACSYAVFGFSRFKLCPCATPEETWCDNVLRVRIERHECDTIATTCGATPVTLPRAVRLGFGGRLATLAAATLNYAGGFVWSLHGLNITLPTTGGSEDYPDDCGTGVITGYQVQYSPSALGDCLLYVTVFITRPEGIGVPPQVTFTCAASVLAGTLILSPLHGEIDLTYTLGDPLTACTGVFSPIGDGGLCFFEAVSFTVDAVDPDAPPGLPGYNGPAWYVTTDGVVYLNDESAALCLASTVILCGGYLTEELAAAAAAAGCGDDDCTPIAGWAGAGWYCVETGGGSGGPTCTPLELLEEDKCDPTVTICPGGPYATEAEALAACGDAEPPHARYDCVDGSCVANEAGEYATLGACEAACAAACCPPGQDPDDEFVATVTLGAHSGGAGMYILPGFDSWSGNTSLGGDTASVSIACVNGLWTCTVRVSPIEGGGSSTVTFYLSGGPPKTGSGTFSGGTFNGQTVSVSATTCV